MEESTNTSDQALVTQTTAEWIDFVSSINSVDIVQTGLSRHGFKEREHFLHRRAWSFHFYHYQGSFIHEDKVYHFDRDWVSLLPPGHSVEWFFPRDAYHHYAHFLPARAPKNRAPLILNARPINLQLQQDFLHIITTHNDYPSAAATRLQDVLWKLALSEQTNEPLPELPSPVQIAISLIRNRLDHPLRVTDLAKRCSVSTGHLNRLFKQNLGASVQEFIQQTRLEQARLMLEQSNLPVQSIAQTVGFEDLQAFNKFIRKHLGKSPRKYREAQHEE